MSSNPSFSNGLYLNMSGFSLEIRYLSWMEKWRFFYTKCQNGLFKFLPPSSCSSGLEFRAEVCPLEHCKRCSCRQQCLQPVPFTACSCKASSCSWLCQTRAVHTEISHAGSLPWAEFLEGVSKKDSAVSKNKIRRKHIVLAIWKTFFQLFLFFFLMNCSASTLWRGVLKHMPFATPRETHLNLASSKYCTFLYIQLVIVSCRYSPWSESWPRSFSCRLGVHGLHGVLPDIARPRGHCHTWTRQGHPLLLWQRCPRFVRAL